ncbi:cytochrome c oxidase subunit II [soil metagenome]
MSNRLKKSAFAAAALWLGPASAALAEWELNMPVGVTDITHETYRLHMLILGVCAVIGVIVFGAMIYSIFAHRKARGRTASQFTHSTKIEVIWTTIPFLILVAMAIPSAETLIRIEDTRNSDITIQVTAYQWKWHYNYLDEGVEFFSNLDRSSNMARQLDSGVDPFSVENYLLEVDEPLVVPVDNKVRLLVTSNDVLHSWWVPELSGKRDAVPGFLNDIWFEAREVGTYRGQCTELCGRDHAFMPIVVDVVSEADYADWLEQRRAASPTVAGADVNGGHAAPEREWTLDELMTRGEDIYQSNCVACHQADGQGITPMFPSLVESELVRGDVARHIDVVLNGRPGTAMQAFGPQLDDAAVAAVVTYVRNAWDIDTGDVVQPAQVRAARSGERRLAERGAPSPKGKSRAN